MAWGLVVAGSNSTIADSVAKFTLADITPWTWLFNVRSTEAAQFAQLIPTTGNSMLLAAIRKLLYVMILPIPD